MHGYLSSRPQSAIAEPHPPASFTVSRSRDREPGTIASATARRAADRFNWRPASAPAVPTQVVPVPILEEHRVIGAAQYLSIDYISPSASRHLPPLHTRHIRPTQHPPNMLPARAAGRLDGKPFAGRVGRCRGLGGNPTAWRPMPAQMSTESRRSFGLPNTLPANLPGVGMRTDVWSKSDACIYSNKLGN